MRSLRGLLLLALIGFMAAAFAYYIGYWQPDPQQLDVDNTGPHLVKLAALALVIGGSILFARPRLGDVFRAVVLWGGLGILLVAGYAMRYELETVVWRTVGVLVPGYAIEQQDGTIALVRDRSGHFTLDAGVGDKTIHFLVDTGASVVTLSHEDAEMIGIDTAALSYRIPVTTANGRALVAGTTLDALTIAGSELRTLRVFVAPQGKLDTSLFGMNGLDRFASWRVEKGRMILQP